MENDQLKETQRLFLESIQNTDSKSRKKVVKAITPAGELTADESIQVYSDDYLTRHRDALCENFDSIWYLLGDEEFFTLCEEYIKEFPTSNKSLEYYGSEFEAFLKGHPSLESYPYLVDLSRLERTVQILFNAKLDVQLTSGETTEALYGKMNPKILLCSHVKFLKSDFKILDLFNMKNLEKPEFLEWQSPQFIITYKVVDEVFIDALSKSQYQTIISMDGTCSLEDCLDPEISEDETEELFGLLVNNSLIKSIS